MSAPSHPGFLAQAPYGRIRSPPQHFSLSLLLLIGSMHFDNHHLAGPAATRTWMASISPRFGMMSQRFLLPIGSHTVCWKSYRTLRCSDPTVNVTCTETPSSDS